MSRPRIDFEQVWCELCNRPVEEFDESGAHNLWGKPDATGHHRGYILIRAYCHGDKADIKLTFTDARANPGRRIVAFAAPVLPFDPAPALAAPMPPVLRLLLAYPPLPLLLMESAEPRPSI